MRPIRETIPIEEALALVMAAGAPIDRTERVHLQDANGRVVAGTITAQADVPPFDRAAMDGYAVVAEDTFGAGRADPRILRCLEKVHTGQMPSRPIVSGECMEIATGAPVPAGANAVVMVEETEQGARDEVRIMMPVYPGQNVGRRGGDLTAGNIVMPAGTPLNPSRVGALAAAGAVDIEVHARPIVAILSTGNEVVEPGRPLGPAQIYDINRYTLSAIVSTHGGVPLALPATADTIDDLTRAVGHATSSADIIVFSGGSSVGEKDLVLDVLRSSGEVLFHGIAVKPGKPTVFGKVNGKPVLGMPGNPTSCLSNAYLLLIPLLRKMARLPAYEPHTVRVPLARRIVSTTGRHQFYTVKVVSGSAVPAFKASGDITSMSHADGYLEIPAQTDIVEAGELVEIKLF